MDGATLEVYQNRCERLRAQAHWWARTIGRSKGAARALGKVVKLKLESLWLITFSMGCGQSPPGTAAVSPAGTPTSQAEGSLEPTSSHVTTSRLDTTSNLDTRSSPGDRTLTTSSQASAATAESTATPTPRRRDSKRGYVGPRQSDLVRLVRRNFFRRNIGQFVCSEHDG